MSKLPTPFPIPSLRPSTHRPLDTQHYVLQPWSPLFVPHLFEVLLECLEPLLVAVTLSGHKANDVVVVLESSDGNPQHTTELSIDPHYWHVASVAAAMRGDAVETLAGSLSDRAAGYIAVGYYPRPGFGDVGFPSRISLDGISVAHAAPVQVRDILGNAPGTPIVVDGRDIVLDGRWILASLGNDPTPEFSVLVTGAVTATCEQIIPILESADPEQGLLYFTDTNRWSLNAAPQPPPDPSLDSVAGLIRTTSLDQAPTAPDWIRQEVFGQKTTLDRLELAAFGDPDEKAELERTVRAFVRAATVPQLPSLRAIFEAPPGTAIEHSTWSAFLLSLHTFGMIDLYSQIPRADMPAPAEQFFGSWADNRGVAETVRRLAVEGWESDDWALLPLMFWLIGCAGSSPTSEDVWFIFDSLNRIWEEPDRVNLSIPMPDSCTIYRVSKFAACILEWFTNQGEGADALEFWVDGRARDLSALTYETFRLPDDSRGIETMVGYKPVGNDDFVVPHVDRIVAWLARACTAKLWNGVLRRLFAPSTQLFPDDPDNLLIAHTVPVGQGPSPLSGLTGSSSASDVIYPPVTAMRFRPSFEGALPLDPADALDVNHSSDIVDDALFYFGGVTLVSEITVTATAGSFSVAGTATSGWQVQVDSWRIRIVDSIDFNPQSWQNFLSGDLAFRIDDAMHIQLTTDPCPTAPEPMDFYVMTDEWYELLTPNQPLDALTPRSVLIPQSPIPDPAGGPPIEIAYADGSPYVIDHDTYCGPATIPAVPVDWTAFLPDWPDVQMPSAPGLW